MSGPPLDGYEPRSRSGRLRPTAQPDDGIARCSFCRAKVVWAFPVASTRRGSKEPDKPTALDHEPDPNGRFTLYEQGGRLRTGELKGGQLAGWKAAGKPVHTKHFQNCPKKSEWGQRGQAYSTSTVQR